MGVRGGEGWWCGRECGRECRECTHLVAKIPLDAVHSVPQPHASQLLWILHGALRNREIPGDPQIPMDRFVDLKGSLDFVPAVGAVQGLGVVGEAEGDEFVAVGAVLVGATDAEWGVTGVVS